jgi:hypothetical protein
MADRGQHELPLGPTRPDQPAALVRGTSRCNAAASVHHHFRVDPTVLVSPGRPAGALLQSPTGSRAPAAGGTLDRTTSSSRSGVTALGVKRTDLTLLATTGRDLLPLSRTHLGADDDSLGRRGRQGAAPASFRLSRRTGDRFAGCCRGRFARVSMPYPTDSRITPADRSKRAPDQESGCLLLAKAERTPRRQSSVNRWRRRPVSLK